MRDRIELERNEMSEILAQNFALNDQKFDASDFEWSAHCLQMAGFHKQEWISMEERLPEVEQVVLCCLGLVQNVYTYKGDNTWEDSYGYWQKDEPITHWMPLPEPPRTPKKEDE